MTLQMYILMNFKNKSSIKDQTGNQAYIYICNM